MTQPADLVDAVRKVWCDVLRQERVPLDANFFELGGNSRLLVMLFERLNALTDRELVAADLFSHSTVRSQATLLAGGTGDDRAERPSGRNSLAARRLRVQENRR
jgi:hypothetical protein